MAEDAVEKYGFHIEALNGMNDTLQTVATNCIDAVTSNIQGSIVNEVKDAWTGPSIVKYFESVDKWVNDVIGAAGTGSSDPKSAHGQSDNGSGIVGAFDALRAALKEAGEVWRNTEISNGATEGEIASIGLNTTIKGLEEPYASVGITGDSKNITFEPGKIETVCGKLEEVKSAITGVFDGQKLTVQTALEAAFEGGGQVEAITTCFDKINAALGDLFKSLSEDGEAGSNGEAGSQSMKTAFKTAKTNYDSATESVRNIFNVDGSSSGGHNVE